MRIRNSPYGRNGYSCNIASSIHNIGMGTPNVNVYPSNLPGIGMTITRQGTTLPSSYAISGGVGISSEEAPIVELVFIRTGTITASSPLQGTFSQDLADTQVLYEYEFTPGGPPSPPQKPTCALQPIRTVPLGTHSVTQFNRVGTVTVPQDFEVELACSGGDAGTSTRAYVTLTDNSNASNTSNVLSLSSSNVRGIGVQILRNGNALQFGQKGAAIGSPNVWEAGTVTPGNSTFRIPLQARYLQTGPVTGGGPANAQALLTVNYR